MNIMCLVQHHAGGDYGVWNEGYCFSHCTRCHCDLIRTSGNWRAIPRGYRVIWRAGHHSHAIPSDFKRNLPLVVKRRLWWQIGWKLGLHRRGVGCILLPADEAYRNDPTAPETAIVTDFVVTLVIVILSMLRSTGGRPAAIGRNQLVA